jgi:hypothetical protein
MVSPESEAPAKILIFSWLVGRMLSPERFSSS